MTANRFLVWIGRALVAGACMVSPVLLRSQSPAGPLSREYVQGHEVMAGEVLVRFRADANARMAQIERDLDADTNRPIGDGTWRRIRSTSRSAQALLTALSSRADVLEVEPNYIVHSTVVPNDPLLPQWLWNLINPTVPGADIHAANAWNVSTGSTGVVVGVIDTGIELSHPDLAANIWSAPSQFTVNMAGGSVTCPAGSHGLNAITLTCIPADDNGHGTHVSGTIGGVGNNGIGVVGVNWTTRMMGLKFLDSQGSGSTSDAVDAIDFAIQAKAAFAATNGANVRVLSNSWGGPGSSSALSQAIQRAANANILFVAAAGNSNENIDAAPFYPASYTNANVVAVAATDSGDAKASFSSYGATSVDLGAPGVGIVSTYLNGSYTGLSGTSMATPHVSGAAALVLSACNLNTTQLKAAILNNVDVIPSMTGITVTNGRLNADKAIRSCASAPVVSLTSPTDGATFTAPATIALAATATDPDGINRVEFYQGTTLIGTAFTSPYGGTWSNVAAGNYTLTAKAYDSTGVATVSASVAVTVTTTGAARTNVALASNGATAIASSTYGSGFAAGGTINGDRKGQSWGNGGGWNDATPGTWPDWLEVDFAGSKTIDEVDVFSVQDNYTAPVEPTAGMTFTRYGLTAFTVQYWNGTQWLAVPNGVVSANALVWRQVTFTALTTTKIRILATGAADSWSRLTEVEAYQAGGAANMPPTVTLTGPAAGATYTAPASIALTADAADADGSVKRVDFYENGNLVGSDTTSPYAFTWVTSVAGAHTLTAVATDNLDVTTTSAPVQITVNAATGRTNVALPSNGATAIASSTYASGFDASGAINGDRKGQSWGNGGGWNDATPGTWPDWLEVDFAGSKTIDEVDVFSVQDNYTAPVEPTAGMTFTRYGVTAFTVQYWDGTQWQAVPNGVVTGNALVWRQVTFTALTTTKIRVLVTAASDTWSRLTEVEAYQAGGAANMPPTVTLTGPAAGTTYTAPASIALTADAADADGSVKRVDFYENGNLVGSDTTSPYAVTWVTSVAGAHTLTAVATDNLDVTTTSAPVQITVNAATGRTNVALASNGATAIASSTYSNGFDASGAINGDRKGQSWGNGGGWTDATPGAWPDWLEIDFAGSKTIEEVDVFSVQDNYAAPAEPTAGMTFTRYGLINFTVQYWTGTQWLAVPGGIVSGNSLVWCQLTFAPLTTTKIRILVSGTADSWSRVTEVEAYSPP